MEYEALGENFHNRGRRSEEQITLMRALWTQEVVSFEGRWDKVTHAGLNPLPVQQPIPIWLGGSAEAVVRRVGRMADGWFPQFAPGDAWRRNSRPRPAPLWASARATLDRMHGYAREAGRDPSAIGIEGRIVAANTTPDDWAKQAKAWQELGASHIQVDTMKGGLRSPQEHIDTIRRFKGAVSG